MFSRFFHRFQEVSRVFIMEIMAGWTFQIQSYYHNIIKADQRQGVFFGDLISGPSKVISLDKSKTYKNSCYLLCEFSG